MSGSHFPESLQGGLSMDQTDRRLLAMIADGIPVTREPFAEIAQRLAISESDVLQRLHRLKQEGVIRRFRARINQRKAGISANALVAWQVPVQRQEEAGLRLAAFPGVTHCYERRSVPGRWEFTHYTVHHGPGRDTVEAEIKRCAGLAGLDSYLIIFSTEELKRVPTLLSGGNGDGLP